MAMAVRSFMRLAMLFVLLALAQPALAAPPAAGFTPLERTLILETLRGGGEPVDAAGAGLDDATLRASLMRHATGQLGLRLRPSQVDRLWAIEPAPRHVEAEFEAARADGRLASWLQSLAPAAREYRALATGRRRYSRIVDSGGWTSLPDGPSQRLGDRGAGVAALRVRLAVEGYPLDPASDIFDGDLETVLKLFQKRHALQPDGVLGPRTRHELNVPAGQRLAQIEANLERRRWLGNPAPERVEVDIAGAQANLYRDGAPALSMRVVVGDIDHRTPMFASRLESVVLNPPWNVPASIAAKELLPKEARNPGYLARNHFSFAGGALRQQPGPWNALGRLKFDLPSPFGVYLHDTPGRAAFAREDRRLSHGCIRLEKPRELAAALLEGQGWTPQRIEAAIAGGETLRTPLAKPVALYVLYWTAVVEADGAVSFRPDAYGWDAKLTRALAGTEARASLRGRADSECSAANSP